QGFLGLEQALARGVRLLAQQADVGLALRQRIRPGHAGRRRVEQAHALLLLLEIQGDDLALDLQAGVTAGLGFTLALEHPLARGFGAVLPQPDERLQRIALHGNRLLSASADCVNGTSSCADCCSSLRIGPIFSMAASASGSVPRLYSPSCS